MWFLGGSPRIYAGEERFSAPEHDSELEGALALGVEKFLQPAVPGVSFCILGGRSLSSPWGTKGSDIFALPPQGF